MRSGRSEFRLGARPRLLDGLGDVGCLAGGLAVVDGHFADSLRRSEHIAELLPPILISAWFMSLLTSFGEEWVDWQNWDRNKGAP